MRSLSSLRLSKALAVVVVGLALMATMVWGLMPRLAAQAQGQQQPCCSRPTAVAPSASHQVTSPAPAASYAQAQGNVAPVAQQRVPARVPAARAAEPPAAVPSIAPPSRVIAQSAAQGHPPFRTEPDATPDPDLRRAPRPQPDDGLIGPDRLRTSAGGAMGKSLVSDARAELSTLSTPPVPGSADLVVCLVTERVWGILDPYETVTVSVNGIQMGADEADGIGYFWTTLYNSDGYRPGLAAGDVVAIYQEGVQQASVTLRSMAAEVDLNTNVVSGTIGGGGQPLDIIIYLPWGEPWMGSHMSTGATDGSGNFSIDTSADWDMMIFDEPLVAYIEDGVEVHRTFLPEQGLAFYIAPFPVVQGYAPPETTVAITVYDTDGVTVQETGSVDVAPWPQSWYFWYPATDVQVGDTIEVQLESGLVLSRTVENLTRYANSASNQVTGTSVPGAEIRCLLYSEVEVGGRNFQSSTTADASGYFTLSLGSIAEVLPNYGVTIYVPDAEGDILIARGAAPGVVVHQTWNQVSGQGGPNPSTIYSGEPITLTIYTAATDSTSEFYSTMSNYGRYSFSSGLPDIAPGDTVTVTSAGWQGVVEVQAMTTSIDRDADRLSGTVQGGSDHVELDGSNWNSSGLSPVAGSFGTVVTATSGNWTADLQGFDLSNESSYDVLHRVADENGEQIRRQVEFLTVYPGYSAAVGYAVPPGTVFTVTLKDDGGTPKMVVAGTSQEPTGYTGWLDLRDDSNRAEIGDFVNLQSAAGFSTTVEVVDLFAISDGAADRVTGYGPANSRLFVSINDLAYGWVSSDPAGQFTVTSSQLQNVFGAGELTDGSQGNLVYVDASGNRVVQAISARYLRVRYAEDWVQLNYPAGHTVWITVTDEGGSEKAHVSGATTGDAGWDSPGFQTNWDLWSPAQPDIQPSDWVLVRADDGWTKSLRIGDIQGFIDVDADTITGTVSADWWTEELFLWGNTWECCPDSRSTYILPDGSAVYTFDCSGEFDLQPGQWVEVTYVEPDGDEVRNRFREPRQMLRVNYGHEWVQVLYAPGQTFWVTVTDSAASVKATAQVETTPGGAWGDDGWEVRSEEWVPSRPDIQPGDWVFASAENGYANSLHIGIINGDLDLDADTIVGTVDASWLTDPVNVQGCIWSGSAPCHSETIQPDGSEQYAFDWSGEFDLLPGHNVAIAYSEPDGDEVYNVFREPAPNAWLEKWVEGNYQIAPGGTVVYKLRYHNDGDAVAAGMVLTDTLPAGSSYIADSLGGTASSDVVTWTLPSLDPGQWRDIFLVLQNTASASDTLHNDIDIRAPNDPDTGNDHAEVDVHVADGAPDVWIDKWHYPGDPTAGETYLVEINYGNSGPVPSGPVWLTETLPLSTTVVGWTSGNEYGLWSEALNTSAQYVLYAPALPGNWSDAILLRLRVDKDAAMDQELPNTVRIDTSGDSNTSNNQDSESAWVRSPRRDGRVTKNYAWGRMVPGGQFQYWLEYSNDGNLPVHMWVTDTLPAGTAFDYCNSGYPLYAGFDPDYNDGTTLAWDLGWMEPGDRGRIDLYLRADTGLTPPVVVTNCFQVTVDGVDEDLLDNQVCVVSVVADVGPNLRVEKQYWWENNNQTLRYEIRAWNLGTTDLTDVYITDTYPLHTTFNGNWWWNGWWGPEVTMSHDADNRHLVFYTAEMEPNEPHWIDYRVDLDNVALGDPEMTFVNMVEAPYGGDMYPVDNYATLTVHKRPNAWLEKWVEGNWQTAPGSTVVYKLRYHNDGGGVASGMVLTDTLPAGTTYVADSLEGTVSGDQVSWNLPTLNPGEWCDILLVLRHTASAGQTLHNEADIYVVDDAEPWNNHAEADVHVADGQPELYIDKWYDPGDPVPGQTFEVEMYYANNGPVPSGPVWLTETLPLSTTVVGWTSQNNYNLWTEVLSTSTQYALYSPAIPGYWGDYLKLRLRLDPAAVPGQELADTVRIDTSGDSYLDNNQDSDSAWVGEPRLDGRVWSYLEAGRTVPGGYLQYWVEFHNDGNMAQQFVLGDSIPSGTSFDYATRSPELCPGPYFEPSNVSPTGVSWATGVVEPGDGHGIRVILKIDDSLATPTLVQNHLTLAVSDGDVDWDDNFSNVNTVIRAPGPNVYVEKQYWWEGNGRLRFNIKVWNVGTEDLTEVYITDTYHPDLRFDGDWWSGDYWGPGLDATNYPASHELVFHTSKLYSSERTEANFRLWIDDDGMWGKGGLAYTNTVSVPVAGDVYPEDNSALVVPYSGPNLFVQKWLASLDGDARPGELVTFTVKLGNHNVCEQATSSNADAYITDTLPAELEFVKAVTSWDDDWEPMQVVGNQFVWNAGRVWCDRTWYIDIVARITDTLTVNKMLTNTIEVYSQGFYDTELYPEDNQAQASFLALGAQRYKKNDLDGDGLMDLVVFRPSVNAWFVLKSGTGYNPAAYFATAWGAAGDIPISGDLDGDRKMDLIVYRPAYGFWFGLRSTENYSPANYFVKGWGAPSDQPMGGGDIDGDGKMDLIIFRPSVNAWFVLKSSNNYDPAGYMGVAWGASGDIPLLGDLDGDGRSDIIVYRPTYGVWFALLSSNNFSAGAPFIKGWGAPGDQPIAGGDLDGDGKMDLIVYRPSVNVWFAALSSTNYTTPVGIAWGASGDIPIGGANLDTDGKMDPVVYRPAFGFWFGLLSSNGYDPGNYFVKGWGAPTDQPVK